MMKYAYVILITVTTIIGLLFTAWLSPRVPAFALQLIKAGLILIAVSAAFYFGGKKNGPQ
jgi:hypothetical protein